MDISSRIKASPLENVYADIARSMNDIDILIERTGGLYKHFAGLGLHPVHTSVWKIKTSMQTLPPMQKSGGMMVKYIGPLLKGRPFTIDAEALWVRTVPAKSPMWTPNFRGGRLICTLPASHLPALSQLRSAGLAGYRDGD